MEIVYYDITRSRINRLSGRSSTEPVACDIVLKYSLVQVLIFITEAR
jgi:hypothetical protein